MRTLLQLIFAAVLVIGSVGCLGGNNAAPPDGTIADGGTDSNNDTGSDGGESCVDEATTQAQLLNSCDPNVVCEPSSACDGISSEAFDNADRLPLLGPNGELPELP